MDRFNNMRMKGINTNDANAIESDILEGKTAYVAGKKITGILKNTEETVNSVMTEIYDWCAIKGAYMPSERNLENLAECVKSISQITEVTVSFSTGTTEEIPSQTIVYGHSTELPIPTIIPADKVFDCWVLDGVPVTNSTPITQDCTLTIRWAGILYLIEESFSNNYVIGKQSERISTSFNRANCRSVTILNDGSVPTNGVVSWDISKDNDGSVMAYVDTTSTDVSYNLYISGNGKIMLPANSSHLFREYGTGGTIAFNNLDSLGTSNVTNMQYMFSEVGTIDEIVLNNWDTSNVTDMSYMFAGNWGTLGKVNLTGFNTKKVITMERMFYQANGITILNLSTFELDSIINMTSFLSQCNYLTELDVRSMEFSKGIGPTAGGVQLKYKCVVYCKDETAKTWLQNTGEFMNVIVVGAQTTT